MMRNRIVFWLFAAGSWATEIHAQEGYLVVDYSLEYVYSSPLDSVPVTRQIHLQSAIDSSALKHITYRWDDDSGLWIHESMVLSRFEEEVRCLDIQTYSWILGAGWSPPVRTLFWYDPAGEILSICREIRGAVPNKGGWMRVDSTGSSWDEDSLVYTSDSYRWDTVRIQWELTESSRLESILHEDHPGEEYRSVLDTNAMVWIDVSRTRIETGPQEGSRRKVTSYPSGKKDSWIDYIRQEYFVDPSTGMEMEERYVWNFWRSDWDLAFRGGVSRGEEEQGTYVIGIRDNHFHRWQVYDKVVSERITGNRVHRTTVYTRNSNLGEWRNKSRTQYRYDALDRPTMVIQSRWDAQSSSFEVRRKKFFFYTLSAGDPVSASTRIDRSGAYDPSYRVFPNPATDKVRVEGPESYRGATLFNLQGMKLLTSREREINLSGLSPGMYVLRIFDSRNHPGKILISKQ